MPDEEIKIKDYFLEELADLVEVEHEKNNVSDECYNEFLTYFFIKRFQDNFDRFDFLLMKLLLIITINNKLDKVKIQ